MSVSVLTAATAALLRLDVRVAETDWSPLYNRLEVWRSLLGENGPYEELSASSWKCPEISCVPGAQMNLVGKELSLLVNETQAVVISFTGSDPLSRADVVAQLLAQGHGLLLAYESDGVVFISTVQAGGLASLRVVGGDAAAILGLPLTEPDSLKYGQDPRLPLMSGVSVYSFTDYWSDSTYFYRTRFSNSLTGAKSAFSEPIAATQRLGIDPSKVAIGYVRLLLPDGRPAATQEVLLYNTFAATRVEGMVVVGGPKQVLTDANGYAEFSLLRGFSFDIGVHGTSFIRRVTVPTDTTVLWFDVFDPAYGEDDAFTVQRTELPYADRKTL